MPRTPPRSARAIALGIAAGCALFSLWSSPARACTIFVLTDTNHAFFFNNEDWSNPNSRIWFIPAHLGNYGYVCVGFDSGRSEGGLNTKGLAYDVVAGFEEKWSADARLRSSRGHSPQRMLETCGTVQEAIAFYRQREEPGFARCKLLVADKTGASAIIGYHEGKLQIDISGQCRGFGYGGQTLDAMLAKHPEPTVANGAIILRACRQTGQYATKYSNVFDLKSGEIFLFPFADRDEAVTFNLLEELKKDGHYFDMPQLQQQRQQPLRPLLPNMKR
jgi:hypothetical protein